jgi:hypothetical protein
MAWASAVSTLGGGAGFGGGRGSGCLDGSRFGSGLGRAILGVGFFPVV